MKPKTDYAQIGLVGCILCIIFMIISNTCKAQGGLSLLAAQDIKLATIGDKERGYDPFTTNILLRFKMNGNQNKHGFLVVFPEFEYADIDGDYYRYSANVGYTFNELEVNWFKGGMVYWLNRNIVNKMELTPTLGWGWIDRYGKSLFSFGASLEITYNLSDRINIGYIAQLTERKDLLWLWGENKIGYSGFVLIEIKL